MIDLDCGPEFYDALAPLVLDDAAGDAEVGYFRSIIKASFTEFALAFWDQIPGVNGPPTWNWHMSLVCAELQQIAERVFRGEPKAYDGVLNISPGTSKTSLVSILFHAWVWTRMPHARFIVFSHTAELVLDISNKARDVIRGERYRRVFPEIVLKDDQDAKGYYANMAGGFRLSCTVGGRTPTGFHAHFILGDDPIDPQRAVSDAELKTAAAFVNNVIPTRKVDKLVSVTFLVMQRLRGGDPTDVMLEAGKKEGGAPVRHLCLPAELPKGDDGAFGVGNVTPPELVCLYRDGLMDPRRLNRVALREAYAKLGEYGYSGQFRQSPVSLSGGLFKVQFFNRRVRSAPYDCKRVRYWDLASTAEAGKRTAGVLMALDKEGNYYVEHVVLGQWETQERNERMLATAHRDREKYGPHAPVIYVEREGGSSGVDAFKGVARTLAGFNVQPDFPTGKKEVRAEPLASQMGAGNVFVVEDGTWSVLDYVTELTQFPLGFFADQTDASSGAFNRLVGHKATATVRTYALRDPEKLKKNQLRIALCGPALLPEFVVEQPALLVHVADPNGKAELPTHSLKRFVDGVVLTFADVHPADHQATWEEPVAPYGLSAGRLMMLPEHGKKLWAALLKKRPTMPEVLVLSDEADGGVAESVAYAICEVLRQDRSTIYEREDPEANHAGRTPPNGHVYEIVKAARSAVV